ncbi:hypothetical protein CYMTET_21394, partial [Cymbomonas tetramitiformis]
AEQLHEDSELKPRDDGYWPAYIVKAGGMTRMAVTLQVDVTDSSGGKESDLAALEAAWIRVHYFAYGPHGRTPQAQHVVLPLQFPAPPAPDQLAWRRVEGADIEVAALPTHLLCHMDDPISIVQKYALPYASPGDIIAFGESPLALMQGRFRHPAMVKPGIIARLACLCFHPTSSLATACGMQALVDVVGAWRVASAVLLGIIGRIIRQRGVFYRVAGDQAALIDDVTGTLPPYDQFICLGPARSKETCDKVKEATGIDMAVVDVNDLTVRTGAVRILGASDGVDPTVLRKALRTNPAGNADEQTPLVLIRRLTAPSDDLLS